MLSVDGSRDTHVAAAALRPPPSLPPSPAAQQSASIKKYFDSGEWALAAEGKLPVDALSVNHAIGQLPKLYL